MNTEAKTHPSYGMVGFSRAHVGGGSRHRYRLFGSPLNDHHTIVTLTVKRAEMQTDLDREWYHGTDELIEVEMSAAQFAELLTSMNVGDGVPCTIRHVLMQESPRPPNIETESERVRVDFVSKIAQLRQRVKDVTTRINAELAKSVPEKKRRSWEIDLGLILQEVESHWPFVVDQFQNAAERVVSAAKGEIDAFVTHAVHVTGIKELRRLSGETLIDAPALPPKDEP